MTEDWAEDGIDFDDPRVVAAYDELPLWSAPFGMLLLERVPLAPGMSVLDVGCGTGFPLLELAQRLGPSSTVHGIDPWRPALERAREKLAWYGAGHVHLAEGDAAAMPFGDASFDLVVSNLGINNFADANAALRECLRVAKPGARLLTTSNYRGHMDEFYRVFAGVLREAAPEALGALEAHVAHRTTPGELSARLERAGWRVTGTTEREFRMRFADGAALMRHYFIRLGFKPGWRDVVPAEKRGDVYRRLVAALDEAARREGELSLTIPYGCVEAVKPG
ncbi:class I SAM-dependent methyltransferase [Longimicrobium sp.]|uniref:class I SAM-dependent methyltransferase n=1 Tax=Longimicrobium sp. TaxID=2029185 RepID=UPI002BA72CCB|nr:methyltransferase domain-containing protein [Longimicrobium sp.]HSU12771.1 methyltransferase domain-containing protein [Longimicrobium sp.]